MENYSSITLFFLSCKMSNLFGVQCVLMLQATVPLHSPWKSQDKVKTFHYHFPEITLAQKQIRLCMTPRRHGDNQENKCWTRLSGWLWLANKYAWAYFHDQWTASGRTLCKRVKSLEHYTRQFPFKSIMAVATNCHSDGILKHPPSPLRILLHLV